LAASHLLAAHHDGLFRADDSEGDHVLQCWEYLPFMLATYKAIETKGNDDR
jgi:hypothetical protein